MIHAMPQGRPYLRVNAGTPSLSRGGFPLLSLLFVAAVLVLAASPALAAYDPVEFQRELAALGDRSTGTPGSAEAAELVEARFRELVPLEGAEIGRQTFRLPVRVHKSSELTVPSGRTFSVRPLAADAIAPGGIPGDGIRSGAIYVGRGELTDFNGKKVEGSVVFMDLDSGRNWIHAATLGAEALVYVDRSSGGEGGAPRSLFEDKAEQTPVDFPRFWMPEADMTTAFPDFSDISAVPASLGEVRLSSSIGWENVNADNVWCLIPGSSEEFSGELVVIEGFYDASRYIPGLAPGADEATSVATLLSLAEEFGRNRPERSVILVATAGHAQALEGMRWFTGAYGARSKDIRDNRKIHRRDRSRAARVEKILARPEPLGDIPANDEELVREAVTSEIKDRVESLSRLLGRLRLADNPDMERIRTLADERSRLRQLGWTEDFNELSGRERELLRPFAVLALEASRRMRAEAGARYDAIQSTMKMRGVLADYTVRASVSLHLSGQGQGIGGFAYGWLYDLRDRVNRSRLFFNIAPMLAEAGKVSGEDGVPYVDTLRPGHAVPWQNYLPDRPGMGGEVACLAGVPGLTLATVDDARLRWGTPYDTADRLNGNYIRAQARRIVTLVQPLARKAIEPLSFTPRNGFATLQGRTAFLRQGELFPERAAPGTLLCSYQGTSRFYSTSSESGDFFIMGLSDSKHTVHKAVIEAFRFAPNSSRVIWAVDKRETGKPSYRVKLQRRSMETDLVMFGCRQTSFYNTLEPRTLGYMYRMQLYDGRTDAEPLRYWYSRLDTWDSAVTSIFLEPEARLKMTLSDSVLNRKMLLINATPEDPEGRGYAMAGTGVIRAAEYRAARDMWTLLKPRVENLEERGIVNDRIRNMVREGITRLESAGNMREEFRYDAFLEDSRASWAMASRVYRDVEKTQKDVLFGVLFYIALFIPFAYCLERLFFNFADIHRRILGFLGLLLTTIAVVYAIHPAFRLTYSPSVVILAFFIVGLSVIVSLIIFLRFEKEMQNLQRRSGYNRPEDLSRTRAFAAAFVIGVTNLRRRKIRTALTCVTLIILTFTIMNFTAVKSVRKQGSVVFSEDAAYTGLLMRTLSWKSLPPEGETIIANALDPHGVSSPRVWFEGDDPTFAFSAVLASGGASARADGVVGLGADEPGVSGLDSALVAGRWFSADEPYAMLLPEPLAERLGVDLLRPETAEIAMWGVPFTVVGILSGEEVARFTDLDGEPLSPAYFPSEAGSEDEEIEADPMESGDDSFDFQSRYRHSDPDGTVIIPAATLLRLGGALKAVAFAPAGGTDLDKLALDLNDRFGFALYRGGEEGTSIYFASDSINYSGIPNILIPLVISVLIVLNTMIGSVYERKREIGVYTSVGLAPSHVSFLFIAESLAFAVISVVAGYLLAQGVAHFLAGTSVWAGMTANYSSMAGVAAMLLVIGVVLVSVIYPSKVAANIAIPDVNRSWQLPDDDSGVLTLTLPFLIKNHEQECAACFVLDYYKAHRDVSHGLFSTDDIDFDFASMRPGGIIAASPDARTCFFMGVRVWMAPFDFGIRQRVDIIFCPAESFPEFLEIKVRIVREAGERQTWWRLCRLFLNDLRKQLLVWRSLDPEAMRALEEHFKATMKECNKNIPGDGESCPLEALQSAVQADAAAESEPPSDGDRRGGEA